MNVIDRGQQAKARARNILHSFALAGGIGAITALSAYVLFGASGVIWALITVGFFVLIGPRVAPEVVMRMFGARPVAPHSGGPLSTIVARLAQRAGLPVAPRLYVIPSATLNAFATGSRSGSSIAVTEGLLRRLELHEVAAVLAHEIAHIRNSDLWVMSLADMMSRLTRILSFFAIFLFFLGLSAVVLPASGVGVADIPWLAILLLYFAPALASLMQLALSRAREYDADLVGASLIGSPASLISALTKLERYQGRFWEDIFMPGRRTPQPSLLRSHPPTERRIERLIALQRPDYAPLPIQEPHSHVAGLGGAYRRPRYHWSGYWY